MITDVFLGFSFIIDNHLVTNMKKINFNLDNTKNYADVQQQIVDELSIYLPQSSTREINTVVEGAVNVSLFIRQAADVYIGHNLSDKNYLRSKNEQNKYAINQFQRVLVQGNWMKRKLLANKAIKLSADKIIAVGSPRVDYLRKIQASIVPKSPNQPITVLWAPTHDSWKAKDGSVMCAYPALENELLALKATYDLKIVPHPRNRKNKAALTTELINADVVISDYSSIIYEAWALGKPVIFPRWILGDKIIAKAPDSAEAYIFANDIGYHPTSFKQLELLLQSPLELSDDVHDFMSDYLANYYEGSAAELTSREIIWLANEEVRALCKHKEQQAQQYALEKNWPLVEQVYRELVELDPLNAQYFNHLASTLRKQLKWWQEVEALKSAISLENSEATWHFRLGEALEELALYSAAAEAYNQALQLKPENAEWYYRLGYVITCSGNDCLTAAITAYQKAIQFDTSLQSQRFGIGVFHQARSNWPKAVTAYTEQEQKVTADAELLYRLGMAYDRCYNWPMAEHYYNKALAYQFDKLAWHYRLGFVLERQQKFVQAATAYHYAAANSPKHVPYWWYRLGYALEQGGDTQKAVDAYLQSLPQYALSGSNIAAEYQQHFSNSAVQLLQLDLQQNCSKAEVWFSLAEHFQRQGQLELAAEHYQQAVLRNNEHSPLYYYRLGQTLAQLTDYLRAAEALRQTRILQQPHGVSEEPFKKSESVRQIASYVEYYETLPIQPKTILFESFSGKSLSCNPYAIFLKLYQNEAYKSWRFIWVIDSLEKVPVELKNKHNIFFIQRSSDLYLRAICQTQYLVNNSGFPPYFIKKADQYYLATWHGTPLKTLGKEQKYKFFDHKRTQRNFLQATHIISPNRHTTNILFDSYDIRKIYTGKLAETGYPRIDLTLNISSADLEKLRQELGLDKQKPVALYAPTWRGTLQDIEFDTSRLESDIAIMAEQGYQVLFRGHSLLENCLANISLGCKVVPSHIDTNILLSVVDVLITDYSSIFFDYIPLKRHIIYYTYDIEEYELERGLYFNMQDMPGFICPTIESVKQKLQYCKANPINVAKYEDALQTFNHVDDGYATERVIKFFLQNENSDVVQSKTDKNVKNVLIFPGSMTPNGITTSFLNLINALDQQKINPVIIFSPGNIEFNPLAMEQFSVLDNQLNFIPRFGTMLMSLEERNLRNLAEKSNYKDLSQEQLTVLQRMFRREFLRINGNAQFDSIIHFSGYDEFWVQVFAAVKGIPKAIYLHNDLYAEHLTRFPALNINFQLYKHFDSLVSVSKLTSELNQKNLANRYAINEDKFVFSENIQNPDSVLSKSTAELTDEEHQYFSHGTKTFITIGRLSIEKDHDKLIKAFYQVWQHNKLIRLLIVGEGPLKYQLSELIANLELKQHVFLLGLKTNPFPLLKAADCFVLSSNHEGQPMVLFEAMILNKPIISTDIVGSRSALEGRTGLLVENSIKGLATGITEFLAGKINLPYFDITSYQADAIKSFYKIVGIE